MKYFGERWNAPAFDDAERVPVPVGDRCLLCEEEVVAEDSGVLIPTIGKMEDVPREAAIHIECHLRSVLGDVAHLEQRCSCYGGDAHYDGPYRQGARAVMTWLKEH